MEENYRRKESKTPETNTKIKYFSKIFEESIQSIPIEKRKAMDYSLDVSGKIYSIMQEKGLSYKEMARMANTSEKEITKWVRGEKDFTLSQLAKISVILGEDLITI